MDKKLKIAIPVIAGALAVSSVGAAFASNTDQAPAKLAPTTVYDTAGTNGIQNESDFPYYCGEYGGRFGHGAGLAITQQVADLLDTTVADLRTQLEVGRTLAEIAAEQGISQDVIIDTVIAPYNDHLDIMVKYGYLNEDEAATLREQAWERLQTAITSQYTGQDDWWGHMHEVMDEFGHGGMMWGWEDTPDTDAAPWRGHGGMMGGFGGFGGMMR